MVIRCPICGKKYSYDRMICQDCEDYSNYSGVCEIGDKTRYKWNCSAFLTIKSSAFKSNKVHELMKEPSPEPNNLTIQKREKHNWNCESNYQIYRNRKESFKPLILGDYFLMKNKTDSHLFFE